VNARAGGEGEGGEGGAEGVGLPSVLPSRRLSASPRSAGCAAMRHQWPKQFMTRMATLKLLV
jgi:hypothetical protein